MSIELPVWENSPETPIMAEDLNAYTEAINKLQQRDYIVEEGIDGIWTYRKWASGISECWGLKQVDNLLIDTVLDNCSYTTIGDFALYPAGLFPFESPTVNISANSKDYGLVSPCPYNLRNVGFSLRLYTPQLLLDPWSGTIHINARGRWK